MEEGEVLAMITGETKEIDKMTLSHTGGGEQRSMMMPRREEERTVERAERMLNQLIEHTSQLQCEYTICIIL